MKNILVLPAQFLVFAIYRSFEWLVGRLSIDSCIHLGEKIGYGISWLIPGYRKLVRRNLSLAFSNELTASQIDTLVDHHFEALGKNIFCSIRTAEMTVDEVDEIVVIEGIENTKKAQAAGKGVVMCINHLANWELYARIQPFEPGAELGTLFQGIRNPFLNRHVENVRGRHGLRGFDRRGGFAAPADFLRKGGMLGVLFDQHPGARGNLCPFFNKLVATTTLPAILSLRTGAPMVYANMLPVALGKWKITFSEPVYPPDVSGDRDAYIANATARLNHQLENTIREDPKEWFWVHNRWKSAANGVLSSGPKLNVHIPDGQILEEMTPFRLAVWSPNPLGDACMSLPAVRAIKQGRPDMHLTVCCRENLAPMWRAQSEVDEVIPFPKGFKPKEVGAIVANGRSDFDVAVLLPNSLRSALEAKAAGIPIRIGYRGHHRKRLLKYAIPEPKPSPEQKHHVHRYLNIVRAIGGNVKDTAALLKIPQSPTPITGGEKEIHIGVCPGAEYGNAKRYPIERYAAAIETLRQKHPDTVFRVSIFGSPAEEGIGEDLASQISDPKENRAGKTSIAELVSELQTCHFVATNDTGTMHLAAALGVPTVAIFGSTEPEFTSPIGDVHRVIRHKVDCSPCFKRECPIDYRCMLRIDSSEVVAEMEALLYS